jgi:hypothetical protein
MGAAGQWLPGKPARSILFVRIILDVSVSTKIAERRILVAFIVTSPRTEIFRSAEMIPAAMSRQNLIAP